MNERLTRIESQIRQIKLLLGFLLVIAIVGLPSALSKVIEVGVVTVIIGIGVIGVAYGALYLLDGLVLRRSRAQREEKMEREVLDEFHRSRAENRR